KCVLHSCGKGEISFFTIPALLAGWSTVSPRTFIPWHVPRCSTPPYAVHCTHFRAHRQFSSSVTAEIVVMFVVAHRSAARSSRLFFGYPSSPTNLVCDCVSCVPISRVRLHQ
ncbi:unnamed protein product, partial [Ectocarpus sp. 8 AP-2014]